MPVMQQPVRADNDGGGARGEAGRVRDVGEEQSVAGGLTFVREM